MNSMRVNSSSAIFSPPYWCEKKNMTESQMRGWIEEFFLSCEKPYHFFLYGDLGVGKTTFIRLMGEFLHYPESITSPTYNLVHQSEFRGHHWFHLDLYRCHREEVEELYLEDMIRPDDFVFVEWPELYVELYAPQGYYIFLEESLSQEEARNIYVQKRGFV